MTYSQLAIEGNIITLDQAITYNFQTSSVSDLSLAKSNYTSTFQIPKRPEIVKMFDGLGIPSDGSRYPYEIRNVSCMDNFIVVYTGTLVILKTDSLYYHATVISGIRDFMTTLGDLTFADLPFSRDLVPKTIDNVATMFIGSTANLPWWAYILADYGVGTAIEKDMGGDRRQAGINVDSMAVSYRADYLMGAIESYTGFTFQYDFDVNPVRREYLTFPQPAITEGMEIDAQQGVATRGQLLTDIAFNAYTVPYQQLSWSSYAFVGNMFTVDSNNSWTLIANQAVTLIVRVTDYSATGTHQGSNRVMKGELLVTRGTQLIRLGQEFKSRAPSSHYEPPIYETVFNFEVGDRLNFAIIRDDGTIGEYMQVDLQYIDLSFWTIKQSEELKDRTFEGLKLSTYIKEFMYRWNLIGFQEGNTIIFKRLSEIIENTDAVDWTDKYIGRVEESYDFGFAQNNYIRHSYVGEGDSYFDLNITSDNKNVPESNTMIQSTFFAPSRDLLSIAVGPSTANRTLAHRYDTFDWDEEKHTSKPNNRYYWIGAQPESSMPVNYLSGTMGGAMYVQPSFGAWYVREFDTIAFSNNPYWPVLYRLLNNTRVHQVRLKLTATDIALLDLTKPVYIGQEQSYYMLNKLQYSGNGEATAELVKIN